MTTTKPAPKAAPAPKPAPAAKPAPAPKPAAPKATPAAAPKAAPAPAATLKPTSVIQNGVSRPNSGKTKLVWDIADKMSHDKKEAIDRKTLTDVLLAPPHLLVVGTIHTQYGKWRKFHGLSVAKPVAVAQDEVVAEETAATEEVAAEEETTVEEATTEEAPLDQSAE